MINWFKNRNKKISITVKGVNPQTENEFKFYDFVAKEPVFTLKEWYNETKRRNIPFKTEYESAIIRKIKTGEFHNPINFKEYFGLDFDFIAIDFETANEQRISACALGVVYVKNDTIVNEEYYYIKPPKGQDFKQKYIDIHGITPQDIEDHESFDHYWNGGLNDYFNNNLIIFHNASMDLSILRQLFELYRITDFDIDYLDTMNLASHLGLPKKIAELAEFLNIEIIEHHNPVEDAKLCAHIFADLSDREFDYNKIIYKLVYQETFSEIEKYHEMMTSMVNTYENTDEIVSKYLISNQELKNLEIYQKGFLFTGDMKIPRHQAQQIIETAYLLSSCNMHQPLINCFNVVWFEFKAC